MNAGRRTIQPVKTLATDMFTMSIWMAFFFFVIILYLGISKYHDAVESLAPEERGTLVVVTPGGRFRDLLLTQQDE